MLSNNLRLQYSEDRLSHLSRMIEEDIEEHIETKIEQYKKIEVNRIRSENNAFSRSRSIFYNWCRIGSYNEWKNFPDKTQWLMEDIPSIEAEKSTNIDSKYREDHHPCDQKPTLTVVVFFIPIGVKEFEWSKSSDQTSKGWGRDEDNIEVNIFRKFSEVDKVSKDVEGIRKEKEP